MARTIAVRSAAASTGSWDKSVSCMGGGQWHTITDASCRGARSANPESIHTELAEHARRYSTVRIVVMDSRFALRAPGNDGNGPLEAHLCELQIRSHRGVALRRGAGRRHRSQRDRVPVGPADL